MSVDHRPTWQRIGVDLETHDARFGVPGLRHEPTFTKQASRRIGLPCFALVMNEVAGPRSGRVGP